MFFSSQATRQFPPRDDSNLYLQLMFPDMLACLQPGKNRIFFVT